MKKLLTLLLAMIITIPSAAAIDMFIDGKQLEPDVPPVLIEGRVLIPMRIIFEALDADVQWDDAAQTATATKGETTVTITIDSVTAYVDENPIILDVPAQLVDGRTMVPIRFVSDALGADVGWEDATQTVYVATNQPAPESSNTSSSPTSQPEEENQSNTVYITKTGKRYHYMSTCNNGTYYASTLSEALSRGLTPCQKCVN